MRSVVCTIESGVLSASSTFNGVYDSSHRQLFESAIRLEKRLLFAKVTWIFGQGPILTVGTVREKVRSWWNDPLLQWRYPLWTRDNFVFPPSHTRQPSVQFIKFAPSACDCLITVTIYSNFLAFLGLHVLNLTKAQMASTLECRDSQSHGSFYWEVGHPMVDNHSSQVSSLRSVVGGIRLYTVLV